MNKNLFVKIFSGYLFIAITISSLLFFFSFNVSKSFYIDSLKNDFRNIGFVVADEALRLNATRDTRALQNIVKDAGTKTGRRITAIAKDGAVLADSVKDAHTMENHLGRIEVRQALKGETGASVRFSSTLKTDMLYVAVPVGGKNKVSGAIRVSLPLSEIDKLLRAFRNTTLKIAGLAMFLLLVSAYAISKSITGPVTKLTAAARKVAAGDFGAKVFLRGRDEIKELADNFNNMTEQVKTLFEQVSFQKEELKKVIGSIQDGLVIIGEADNIKFFNEAFKILSHSKNPEGRRYWEALRENPFIEIIRKTKESKLNQMKEFELGEKVILCSTTFIRPSEDVVALLYDVTAIKSLEQIKKDIVVNVSHELRTPLTAIKGYIETMEDGVKGEQKEYLNIIKSHTERLINIVSDLLTLSELEEKGARVQLETINLMETARSAAKLFEQKINEKGLKLIISPENGVFPVKADPFMFEQVFINLLDNAVKYTDKGSITIVLSRSRSTVNIEVSDTGTGIPREHLSRIFERFYVADKSRARKLGGTGLGLSIVKHILLLHNGTINVDSELSKGTKFTVTLPLPEA